MVRYSSNPTAEDQTEAADPMSYDTVCSLALGNGLLGVQQAREKTEERSEG